jgi:hypothetical protein
VVAAVTAVALFVAGVVVWRMTAPVYPAVPRCPANSLCYNPFPAFAHRLHPLRAEMLWVASALLALLAIGTTVRQRQQPCAAETVSG